MYAIKIITRMSQDDNKINYLNNDTCGFIGRSKHRFIFTRKYNCNNQIHTPFV